MIEEKYLKKMESGAFMADLIETFEKLSFYPLWFSSITKSTVAECLKEDPSGVGASIGKMFEYVFLKVCKKHRVPCQMIQEHDADFLIGENTRFEMKTTKDGPAGVQFKGTGTTGGNHKKCGNYIFIGYKLNGEKIVSKNTANKGLVDGLFYSVNSGVIETEDWINTEGKTFILKIPNKKYDKLSKALVHGSVAQCLKYVKCSTMGL